MYSEEENNKRIIEELNYIKASDYGYDTWFQIGTALKHHGIDFKVWDNWSSQDKENYHQKEMIGKWNSFNPNAMNCNIINSLAKENGFTGKLAQYFVNSNVSQGSNSKSLNVSTTTKKKLLTKKEQAELTEAIKNACLKLDHSETVKNYLNKRGISIQTAITYGVGASENDNVFIPTSTNYFERYIQPRYNQDGKEIRYSIQSGTTKGLFNEKVINANTKEPIYVCEGAFDSLSVLQEGYTSIATNSTTSVTYFVNRYIETNCKAPIVICLDNDKPGQKRKEKLQKKLDELKTRYVSISYPGEYKDINEWYIKDKEQLKQELKRAYKVLEEEREAEIEAYKHTSSAYLIDQLEEQFKAEPISTGFKELDYALSGGLYDGLYILGACTGQGKTTFALQICDNIAKSGHDVLIFSLEMSSSELIARSISRNTYEISNSFNSVFSDKYAKSEIQIRRVDLYKTYTPPELDVIDQAKSMYKYYAKNIYIIEGIGNINAVTIKEAINKHILLTGNKPVVLIDYIQLLAPCNERMTDTKTSIDNNILELKRITRDLKLPTIAISSMNRSAYNTSASNSNFKESGSIEYTATVTMQLSYLTNKDEDIKAEQLKIPRKLKLTIMKNRQGVPGTEINYKYYSKFNIFVEDQKHQEKKVKVF